MHEIITLQFGQQANYIGTHYWNTQESYFTYSAQEDESPVDHNRSFRPGIGADGSDTYTPRALIYDLKGAFGTLRRENELYLLQNQPDLTQQNAWGRNTSALQLPPIAESPYQQALNAGIEPPTLTPQTVRFWSDYNHVYYHPRSIVQLNDYELNSSIAPFERFNTGDELFTNLDREHDLLDRDLRPFLEECDQLQAIQLLASTDDAWGGFAARYTERIQDELGKGCRWLFSLQNNRPNPTLQQIANIAQTLQVTSQTASMNIPLIPSFPNPPPWLAMQPDSPWHVSALQTSIVESLTLPTRLKQNGPGQATFDEIEATLNNDGHRPLAAASLAFEEPPDSTQSTVDRRNGAHMANGVSHESDGSLGVLEKPLDLDFFPDMSSSLDRFRLGRSSNTTRRRMFTKYEILRGYQKTDDEIREANRAAQDRFSDGRRSITLQAHLLFPLLKSYPNIINFGQNNQKLGVNAVMQTDNKVANNVQTLARVGRHAVAVDEREAIYDELMTLAEEYNDSIDIGDDGSDDYDDE